MSAGSIARDNWIAPPHLGRGAVVALVAPGGPLRGEEELQRAVANVQSMGWTPVAGANALARDGYFAGPDEARQNDLRWALQRNDVDAIWFLRGGYGSMRLLAALDYEMIRRRPRAFIGFSDITAFHSAIGSRSGLITYHGPTARGELTPFSRASLHAALAGAAEPCGEAPAARTIRAGSTSGRVLGGNLALLSSLVGTPYSQSFAGAILLLEDVNEAVYRVDRMLTQLLLSGALAGCRAIAFGQCTNCGDDSVAAADHRTLDEVLGELAAILGVPCVAGLPVGHIPDQWTVPLGTTATLEAPQTGAPPALRTDMATTRTRI